MVLPAEAANDLRSVPARFPAFVLSSLLYLLPVEAGIVPPLEKDFFVDVGD